MRTLLCVLLTGVFGSGCTTASGNWGSSTTFTPGWKPVTGALIKAAIHPSTWMPLVGAAAFALDDFDQQAVDWASSHNPLFGSIDDAKDASDLLQDLSKVNYLVTALSMRSGPGQTGLVNKVRAIGFGVLAIGINDGMTNNIKSTVSRRRPDRETSTNSFPSLHASSAAVSASLAARNIEQLPLTGFQRKAWQWSSYTVAALTGWARVEGRRHYPSDVLAGYALGNFLGSFLNDAFITPTQQEKVYISVRLDKEKGSLITLSYRL